MKTFKEILKETDLSRADIAELFGYKNYMSYMNSGKGRERLERGLELFYERIKKTESDPLDLS